MTELNPINFNAPSVANNSYSTSNGTPKEKPEAKEEVTPQVERKDIPADKILEFMSQMATQAAAQLSKANAPSKLANASEEEILAFANAHLSPERQESVRAFITAFVNEFEPYVVTNLKQREA